LVKGIVMHRRLWGGDNTGENGIGNVLGENNLWLILWNLEWKLKMKDEIIFSNWMRKISKGNKKEKSE